MVTLATLASTKPKQEAHGFAADRSVAFPVAFESCAVWVPLAYEW